jgi:hypothetical protein
MAVLDLTPGPATPPWLPLVMVGVLLLLLGFLYWSMSTHLKKIRVADSADAGSEASAATGSGSAPADDDPSAG